METVIDIIFLGSKITVDGDCSLEIKTLAPWKKSNDKPRQCIKKQRDYFVYKGLYSQSYGFSSSHEWMWELDYQESWTLKNWCFWTVVLEKTFESPLDCKKIQPVHPKGNQSWIFIRRTDAEAETPILWPPDAKNWLTWKTLMLRKIEGRKRRGRQVRWLDDVTDTMYVSLSKLWELWWTGRPGVLWFMRSQRVRHDWAAGLNWRLTEAMSYSSIGHGFDVSELTTVLNKVS